MRRAFTILTSLSLLLGVFVASPLEVGATGNCNSASATLYKYDTKGTPWVKLCYGVNDSNIESEVGAVIGPDYLGSMRQDFDNVNFYSGVSAVGFSAANSNYRVCIYNDAGYGRIIGQRQGSGTVYFDIDEDDTAGAIKMVVANFC